MSDDKNTELDSEALLMTLDQIGQTLDIMTSMVGRLRGHIEQHHAADDDTTANKIQPQTPNSQTLH